MIKIYHISLYCLLPLLTFSCKPSSDEEHSIRQSIEDIRQLSLAEAEISKTYIINGSGLAFKDVKNLSELANYIDNLLKPGERIGVYQCTSVARAYMDLQGKEALRLSYNPGTRSIVLTLPPITVELLGNKPQITVLHERHTGIKSPITPEERRRLYQDGTQALEKSLHEGNPVYDALLNGARQKALSYFAHILLLRGVRNVTVKLSDGEQLSLNSTDFKQDKQSLPPKK